MRLSLGSRAVVIFLAFASLVLLARTTGAQFTPPPTTVTGTLPIVSTKTTSSNYMVSCPTCGTSSGSVLSVAVANANGFNGTVASPSVNPVITLKTAIGDGIVKSVANAIIDAVAGTDYLAPNGNGSGLTGLTWPQIGSTPTTLAGYGITDSYTKSQTDVKFAKANPLNAVTAATTVVLPFSPTYSNGTAGVGATLTAGGNGVLTMDGYTPLLNDFLMIKNQAAAAQNGIYQITTLGTVSVPYVLTRAINFDTPGLNLVGNPYSVIHGTINGETIWALSNAVNTVGTDPVSFFSLSNATNAKCITWDSTTAVTAQTIDFPVEWAGGYTITGAKAKVGGGGSFTYAIQINGTAVTGLNVVPVTLVTNVDTAATALNTGALDDIISVVIASPSGTANRAYVCPVFAHTVN